MATQYQKCGLTEHEMKCIGLGLPINERLSYSVEYSDPRCIGTFKAYYPARSEENARDQFTFDRPGMEIVRVTLL